MKKILFISSSDMSSTSGGGMANRVLWDALIQSFPHGMGVLHPELEVKKNDKYFFYIPYLKRWQKLTHLLQGKVHRYNPWVLDFIDQHPDEYSHCIINCGLFGDLVEGLQSRGLKVCTIHHNFEAKYQMDNKRPSTFGGFTGVFVKRNESKAYRLSDMNLFLTQCDADQLQAAYGESKGQNHVIGLFEKVDAELSPALSLPLQANHLVISGGLDSVQSVFGIKQFAQQNIPSLSQYFQGDYQLLLAGRNPHPSVVNLQKNNPQINVVANPSNMLDTLQEGGIYICPVSKGSGMKTRILDGLKLGMPILTHRVSAQGYDALWDRPWFQIYDDQESFLKGLKTIVATIQSQPDLRRAIIADYQRFFSFEKGKERYVTALKAFINS